MTLLLIVAFVSNNAFSGVEKPNENISILIDVIVFLPYAIIEVLENISSHLIPILLFASMSLIGQFLATTRSSRIGVLFFGSALLLLDSTFTFTLMKAQFVLPVVLLITFRLYPDKSCTKHV